MDVGGGLPYYVTGKDMSKNEVYVTSDIDDAKLWRKNFELTSLHWINQPPKNNQKLFVRTRHRAPLAECIISVTKQKAVVVLTAKQRALTSGQSAVFYDANRVVGGGIII